MGCLKLTYRENKSPLKVIYRKGQLKEKSVQRCLSTDPLAAEFVAWSTYNYVLGNPVMMVDPDGKKPEWWPGVTLTYLEGDVGLGFAYGLSFINQSGVARDEVGKTHFIMRSQLIVNPEKDDGRNLQIGAAVSATAIVRQSWIAETFYGMIQHRGTTVTGDLGAGLGVTIGFGESEFLIGGGIGASARISVSTTEIIESISLTDDEADDLNAKSQGSTTWSVVNTVELDNGTYEANVRVSGVNGATSNIVIYSKDKKVWMTQAYKEAAKKAEKADKDD